MTAVRIDKWLWAARFFKTRSLAQAAVESGRVLLNTERVKPAKEVRAGNLIDVRIADSVRNITVLELSVVEGRPPRRPACTRKAMKAA